jgi:hypothetical protein
MSPAPAEVAVVGAGPHALTFVLHLLALDPDRAGGLVVLDPAGDWLTTWRSGFRRLHIDTLRSPGVHHPDPDPEALIRWQRSHGRPGPGLPYGIPSYADFDAFCSELIEGAGLAGAVRPDQVHRISPGPGGVAELTTDSGSLRARQVVLATNPHRRRIPEWVQSVLPVPSDRIQHAEEVDLAAVGHLDGEHVAVVGGGLSAGHLAVGAAAAGARVSLLARRPLVERLFDVDPGWLGPRRLRAFAAQPDPRNRLRSARRARGGGTMPPWMVGCLRDAAATVELQILDDCPVVAASRHRDRPRLVLFDGTVLAVDRVWLATGSQPTVDATRCLAGRATRPATVGRLPCLDDHLRIPGTPIHLLGRLAMLSLGPAAGNLWGARVGARRIVASVTGSEVYESVPIASNENSSQYRVVPWTTASP